MKLYGKFVQSKAQRELNQSAAQMSANLQNVSFVTIFGTSDKLIMNSINNMLLPQGVEIGDEVLIELTEKLVNYDSKAGVPMKGYRCSATVVSTNQMVINKFIAKMDECIVTFGVDGLATAVVATPPPSQEQVLADVSLKAKHNATQAAKMKELVIKEGKTIEEALELI